MSHQYRRQTLLSNFSKATTQPDCQNLLIQKQIKLKIKIYSMISKKINIIILLGMCVSVHVYILIFMCVSLYVCLYAYVCVLKYLCHIPNIIFQSIFNKIINTFILALIRHNCKFYLCDIYVCINAFVTRNQQNLGPAKLSL